MIRALVFACILVPVSVRAQDAAPVPPQCEENGQAICIEVDAHSNGMLETLDGYCLHYMNISTQTYFVPSGSGSAMSAYLASGAIKEMFAVAPTCRPAGDCMGMQTLPPC